MNKETLKTLFAKGIFKIPDYQRGYAWEEKQWDDFIQDIDALVDENENVKGHYTGTVVVFAEPGAKLKPYGVDMLPVMDVVDGQQRLTTCCLYLSLILRSLIAAGKKEYESEVAGYLYSGTTCKVTLNNETDEVFLDLLRSGTVNTEVKSLHQKRLVQACAYFQKHIDKKLTILKDRGTEYLIALSSAIRQKLNFTFYTIEEECEIGMTFELMNSRGKDLSVLELLKNYLMHWVSRNIAEDHERNAITATINKSWKDTYANVGASGGNEDQCLRIAWTLYCSHTPANWNGYDGFKGNDFIPLRNFTDKRNKQVTKDFIVKFVEGLREVSRHYSIIASPTPNNTFSNEEFIWLTKIRHTGNIANFLPLMVAARIRRGKTAEEQAEYIQLLQSMECFAYRVFLYWSKRSNAGKSNFHRWGWDVFHQWQPLPKVIEWIHSLIRYYASEESFIATNAKMTDWYQTRHLLKYTLYEYELHLVEEKGKLPDPQIKWDQLSESTIEHILPQTPSEGSEWKKLWNENDFKECLHDIGNLVLTHDNSSYRNFEFARKKGLPGQGPSYSDSDIRQERQIARFDQWTKKEFEERRATLILWINDRWKTISAPIDDVDVGPDEADEDIVIGTLEVVG